MVLNTNETYLLWSILHDVQYSDIATEEELKFAEELRDFIAPIETLLIDEMPF